MNKRQLVQKIAEMSQSSLKNAEFYLDIITEAITDSLICGEEIKIVGYGSFKVHKRKGRTGRNPITGEPIQIPDKNVVVFKAGSVLNSSINY